MILQVSKLKTKKEFQNIAEDVLKEDLEAIEIAIREHTNNNFQKRYIRTSGHSKENKIYCKCPYLKVGDTIEISQSVNDGLYVIQEITEEYIALDKDIFDFGYNLVTKIEYPADVIKGAVDLLKWKYDPDAQKSRNGVASESESISRHSVSTSYKSYDSNNTINGYPVELFGFCSKYEKARF